MRLSTKSEYACLALVDLCERRGSGLARIEDIARRKHIPRKYLGQILLALRRAGYVRSRRGAKGGYALARDPEDVTLAEIVRLMDGALAPVASASEHFYEPTPIERVPALLRVFRDVRDYAARKLESTTFADVARKRRL